MATIDAVLRERTESRPDHVVVRFPDAEVTYRQLSERSGRVVAAMEALDVRPGDHVAVMLPNGAAFLETWFGLARMGAVEVPVNTGYRGDLLHHVLSQTRCRVVVVHRDLVERIAALGDDLDDLEHVVVVNTDATSAPATTPIAGARVADYDMTIASSEPTEPSPGTTPTDHAVVLYTSGTTGPSKGVVLSHNACFRLARTVADGAGFEAGEVLFTAFPLFHVAARYVSVLAAMLVDGSVVVHERFSASSFWRVCAEEGVTAIHYLGTLLTLLLKQEQGPADRDHGVRRAYGAGAPLPVAQEVERRFGLRLFELYGMTETGAVTMNRDGAYRPGTCGTALPDCQVEIHDDRGRRVAPGVEGEIVVRPNEPDIMLEEYLCMPEATLEAIRNLWFHTGDLGSMDGDGFLTFIGRSKDAIRRRGENISAFEVEVVVAAHPDVAACAVIGVPDEISGEEVMAVVVPAGAEAVDPVSLLQHCATRLSDFAVPRYVAQLDALPMNTSQRVEKYRLRAELTTDEAWDREDHAVTSDG